MTRKLCTLLKALNLRVPRPLLTVCKLEKCTEKVCYLKQSLLVNMILNHDSFFKPDLLS